MIPRRDDRLYFRSVDYGREVYGACYNSIVHYWEILLAHYLNKHALSVSYYTEIIRSQYAQ